MANGKKPPKKGAPIPPGWEKRMTGPAWNGESSEKAIAMWNKWLRELDKHCGKMPRYTRVDKNA